MDDDGQIRLFGGDSLAGYLDARLKSACSLAQGITLEEFQAAGPDALSRRIVEQWSVSALVLQKEQLQMRQSDIKVARMVDTDDYGMPVRREEMVRGCKVSYQIPFTGDAQLWQLNNGPWLTPQGALDTEQRILTLTLQSSSDVQSGWHEAPMQETLERIDACLEDQWRRLGQYHLDLAEAVAREVARSGQPPQPKALAMPAPDRTRSGGPNTAAGRSAVSKNAVKHGLTATRPVTAAEVAQADTLRADLLAQYNPQTPLERLQIDRIARTAAKLQRLHEIEEAAFRLAQENAVPSVADIVAGMGPTDPAAQHEAVRILQGGAGKPADGLDDALLAQICDEIKEHGARVANFDEVQDRMPATYAYAQAKCAEAGTTDPGLQLQALMAWLKPIAPVPAPVMVAVQKRNLNTYSDAGLLEILEASGQSRAHADGAVMVPVRPKDDPRARSKGLQEDLDGLLALQQHRLAVQDVLQRYPARLALLQRAAMPPVEEADRLMRYHIALDRQLSKCMGELLHMMND